MERTGRAELGRPKVLVFVPTRELAPQVAEKQAVLAGFGIPVANNPSAAAALMIERLGRG